MSVAMMIEQFNGQTIELDLNQVDLADLLEGVYLKMKVDKPNDRSELDRRYAILITDIEKVMAYHAMYIEGNQDETE